MSGLSVADRVEQARDRGAPTELRRAAFDELVRAFEGMAFGSALRRLRDADEARDAAQEAFLAAWLKLDQLRTPSAFGGWMKRLIMTECSRRHRSRPEQPSLPDPPGREPALEGSLPSQTLAGVLSPLTGPERRILVLFHVLGYRLDEIASMTGDRSATIGKRLYTARLKVRRTLSPAVRAEVLKLRSPARRTRAKILLDYIGCYRFERRHELTVQIEPSRDGDYLVGCGGGQRTRLVLIGKDTLATWSFDGEGRFQRDRQGRVTHFIYYEFGARLGVARKTPQPATG